MLFYRARREADGEVRRLFGVERAKEHGHWKFDQHARERAPRAAAAERVRQHIIRHRDIISARNNFDAREIAEQIAIALLRETKIIARRRVIGMIKRRIRKIDAAFFQYTRDLVHRANRVVQMLQHGNHKHRVERFIRDRQKMRVRGKRDIRANFDIESKIAALIYKLRVFFRQRELSRAPIFFHHAACADIENPRVGILRQRVNRFDEQTLGVRGAELHERKEIGD